MVGRKAVRRLIPRQHTVFRAEALLQPRYRITAHLQNAVRFRRHPRQYVVVLDDAEFIAVIFIVVYAVQRNVLRLLNNRLARDRVFHTQRHLRVLRR